MPSDTSSEQLQRHAEIIRAMSPGQRAQALRAIDRGVRRLVMARLRSRYPDASERELVMRHVAQVYGLDVARRVYGEAAGDLQG